MAIHNGSAKHVADLDYEFLQDEVGGEAAPSNPDSPYQGGGTAVLERPKTEEQRQKSDDGNADRFAHYVTKGRLEESRRTGRPVVALCGKIWKPKHDPSKYPVCPECKRVYEEMAG